MQITQEIWDNLYTNQQRIAHAAEKPAGESVVSVAHHIDAGWMYCAYDWTRKDGAAGIDGVTAAEYEVGLEGKLQNLEELLKSGKYRAPPVRRVYIPKAGSRTEKRPIGIPTYEDKILQRAIVMVLEPILEKEFYDFSYGFRPGKSPHHALDRIWKESMGMNGGYVIDMDISKYFDTIDHKLLREMLSRRVSDGVITRIVGKWLNAGVMDGGKHEHPGKGTPQGGVISPLLSNLFLHEVLDDWFVQVVKPLMRGKASMIRYADDAIIFCELKEDAERIYKVLGLRFEKYGLKIHPEKTRLLDFTKPKDGQGKGNGSFTFLGFTHYWTKSRKGKWIVGRKTDSKRFQRTIKAISVWCKANRHLPLKEQWKTLKLKITGHYAYYGLSLNSRSISEFYMRVLNVWLKWLNRRGRKGYLNWSSFADYLKDWPLPKPKIMHSYC
ncbi:MAG: group II intron reverse transcriptase/maturase [Treponema sp.]|nr:group II intron reverse transcriptase/maturase [Treponema sp.]